jgi:hypothetical protein
MAVQRVAANSEKSFPAVDEVACSTGTACVYSGRLVGFQPEEVFENTTKVGFRPQSARNCLPSAA